MATWPGQDDLLQERRMVFVVGSSRSGTTLVGRILGNHPDIFTFQELHFFEQLWSTRDKDRRLSSHAALHLAARLLCIQRHGYLTHGDYHPFIKEAEDIVHVWHDREPTSLKIFAAFLSYETSKHGKRIPCDQTPRNVFYIDEILTAFPEARVLVMIRDPRDVLLSQKWRWKRRFLGGSNFPLVTETIRSWVSYHPLTISKLWNLAVQASRRFIDEPRVMALRFEDLLAQPEASVQRLCAFIGISFQDDMLDVPQVGSSNAIDRPEQRGINRQRTGSWKQGGLNATEVYLCQKVNRDPMLLFNYSFDNAHPKASHLLYYALSLPVKVIISFLMYIHRMKNIADSIRKRFGFG